MNGEMNTPERIGRSLGYAAGYDVAEPDKLPRGIDAAAWRWGYAAAVRATDRTEAALRELDELESLFDRMP